MMTRTTTLIPAPGEAVRDSAGRIGIVDSAHHGDDFEDGRGPRALVVFGVYGAFRDGDYVSCSGGPGPLVPVAELEVSLETVELAFWRWKDRPRAGGGIEYRLEVPVWRWSGKATV